MLLAVLYYRFLIKNKNKTAESRIYKCKYLRKRRNLRNVQEMMILKEVMLIHYMITRP